MQASGWHIGIDVGGTWTRLLAAGAGGERAEAAPVRTPPTYGELLEVIKELVPAEVRGRVVGVTCGLPGSCGAGRPVFVPALPWLEGKPLAADLSAALGAPASLATDGHLTLLAEAREGSASGARSAVLVAIGTGIGGALMIDGKIWEGHHASAGSWGWLPAEGFRVAGGHGPFERAASGEALSELAFAMSVGKSGPELVEAARSGEINASETISRYARRLAGGIAAIASIIDPEVIVIGGGLSAAMDVLAPLLSQFVPTLASPDGCRVPVRPAAFGPAAGAVGALLHAQQQHGFEGLESQR